jgi:pimeloyl-ACP methyl ester carboxylesterase
VAVVQTGVSTLSYYRAGAGPTLVLIHGVGSHWHVWKPVLDRLTPARDAIALDLPGFGTSPPPPPGTAPGIVSLTRLVAEFLDGLGLERPHVAGNSLGGWVALELAKQERVASATALSPAGFSTPREARYVQLSLRLTLRAARRLAPRARGLMRHTLVRRLAWGQVVAHPERVPAVDAAAAARALARAPWFEETLVATGADSFAPVAHVPVPVTVAWGEKDRLLLPRQAPRAARALLGARSVTLYGCGHVPMYDDPAQVARVLLEGSAV